MVQMHRTISVNVDQSSRLIEMGERKRNTKLDGRECNALFQNGILLIKGRNLFPASPVAAGFFQRFDNFKRDIVFNFLPVGRHISPARIKIALAHIKRIEARLDGNRIHHPLDKNHSLRAAKTTKRCVGNRIGAKPARFDMIGRKEIGIVAMEHGAITHTLA